MERTSIFLCFLTLTVFADTLELTGTFKKCNKRKADFDLCLSNNIDNALKQLDEPISEYGIPKIDPFVVPKSLVAEVGNETACFRQKFSNFVLYGMSRINATSAKMDFLNKLLDLKVTFYDVIFEYDYEVHGSFIVLPVDSLSRSSVTMRKPTFKLTFVWEEYERKNEKYFNIIDTKLVMEPKTIKFNFQNILKNTFLNEGLNLAMEENWRYSLQFWQITFPNFFTTAFTNIFNNFLENVPANSLIDE